MSLAFADNASSGIEPAYGWCHVRQRRLPDGELRAYEVDDHAWRLFRQCNGGDAPLPAAFVQALELPCQEDSPCPA